MEPKKFRSGEGPEAPIKRAIKRLLEQRGWLVIVLHGNKFQSGMPDLFATHINHGIRLIEVKNPDSYHFTPAQMDVFPKLLAHGTGVWVLTSDHETEIAKLGGTPNYHYYVGHAKKPF